MISGPAARILFSGLLLFVELDLVPVRAAEWIVCLQCPGKKLSTIDEALRRSSAGDTITVIYEPQYPIILEHVVINKAIKLTSRHPDLGIDNFDTHPIISSRFSEAPEIIRVTVPGVEISGFNFDNLGALTDTSVPETSFGRESGVLLEAPATISYCKFNHLQTAILTRYTAWPGKEGSNIHHCQIGEPTSMQWDKDAQKHPGNFYGLLLLPPGKTDSSPPIAYSDTIASCKIVGNRYYGVVYSPINQPKLVETIVELNGIRPFRICKPGQGENGAIQWIAE
jgi:hypothetical protein